MDKETLSNYGWIVVLIIVLSVMLALATPFGNFVKNAVWDTTQGLVDVNNKGLSVAIGEATGGSDEIEIPVENVFLTPIVSVSPYDNMCEINISNLDLNAQNFVIVLNGTEASKSISTLGGKTIVSMKMATTSSALNDENTVYCYVSAEIDGETVKSNNSNIVHFNREGNEIITCNHEIQKTWNDDATHKVKCALCSKEYNEDHNFIYNNLGTEHYKACDDCGMSWGPFPHSYTDGVCVCGEIAIK